MRKLFFLNLRIFLTQQRSKKLRKVDLVASGTSYHAGMIGKKIMEQLLEIPVEVFFLFGIPLRSSAIR